MTEMSPLGAIGHPPRDVQSLEEDMAWRAKTGRVALGVELRLIDDQGQVVPWDGESVGEIEVRGRGSCQDWRSALRTRYATACLRIRHGQVGTDCVWCPL
jgi:acyl-CoA synthetase (AMP-forming)/AMP-acid ligase II